MDRIGEEDGERDDIKMGFQPLAARRKGHNRMNLPPFVQIEDRVILFDGMCKLCNGWAQFIVRHDDQRIFRLCSVQSVEGKAILAWHGLPTETFATMLLVEGAAVYAKSDAFFQVVGQLPRPWCYVKMLSIVPRGFRDWLYDRVALNRYRLFGRYKQCVIPRKEDRERYLGDG